jgi:subtilisin family serine protease
MQNKMNIILMFTLIGSFLTGASASTYIGSSDSGSTNEYSGTQYVFDKSKNIITTIINENKIIATHQIKNASSYFMYLRNLTTGKSNYSNTRNSDRVEFTVTEPGYYQVLGYHKDPNNKTIATEYITRKTIEINIGDIKKIENKGIVVDYNSQTKSMYIKQLTEGSYYYYTYIKNTSTGQVFRSKLQQENILNITPGKYAITSYFKDETGKLIYNKKTIDVELERLEKIENKGITTVYDKSNKTLTITQLTEGSSFYYAYLRNSTTREVVNIPYADRKKQVVVVKDLKPGKYEITSFFKNELGINIYNRKTIDIELDLIKKIEIKGITTVYDKINKTLTITQLTEGSSYYRFYVYNKTTQERFYSNWKDRENRVFVIKDVKPGIYNILTYVKDELGVVKKQSQIEEIELEEIEKIINEGVETEYNENTKELTITNISKNAKTFYFYVYNEKTGERTRAKDFTSNKIVVKGVEVGQNIRIYSYIKNEYGVWKYKYKRMTVKTNSEITLVDKGITFEVESSTRILTIENITTGENLEYSIILKDSNEKIIKEQNSKSNKMIVEKITQGNYTVETKIENATGDATKTKVTEIEVKIVNQIKDLSIEVDKIEKIVKVKNISNGVFVGITTTITKQLKGVTTPVVETINHQKLDIKANDISYNIEYLTTVDSIEIKTEYKTSVTGGNDLLTTKTTTIIYSELHNGDEYSEMTEEQKKIFKLATDIQMQQYGTAIGLETAYTQGYTGNGVLVGVVEGRFSQIFADSISDKIVNKSDLSVYDDSTNSSHRKHMNHVASTITGDPLKGWTKGIAYEADLALFQNFTVGLAQAVEYNKNNDRKLDVINNSWGSSAAYSGTSARQMADYYTSAANVVNQSAYNLMKDGTVLIKSAGNSGVAGCDATGENKCDPYALKWKYIVDKYGSELDGDVMIVGSYRTSTQDLWYYSNRAGDLMKDNYIVAPGDFYAETNSGAGTVQLDANGNVITPTDSVQWMTGTSMAGPIVTGAYALMREKHPNLKGKEITKILFETATDLGAVGVDNVYGHGLLNVDKAFTPQGEIASVSLDSSGSIRQGRKLTQPLTFRKTSTIITGNLSNISIPVVDSYGRLFNQELVR